MSGEEDDSDKQYEASQKKLDDARQKGDFARSADLTTAAGYGGFLLAAVALGGTSLLGAGTVLASLLEQAAGLSGQIFSGIGPDPALAGMALQLGARLAPWFALPAGLALLSIIAQRGFVFAPSKLEPKLSRISVISNFGQKFGRTGLFEFAKSLVKLIIYSAVLGIYLQFQMPRIIASLYLTPAMVTVELLRLCLGLFGLVLVVAFALGGIDMVFQIGEHQRKNRMSRKELMDEMKQSEGDPAMKQQRRQRAIDIAMNQMLSDVPRADVIIVNPTHYAVALEWDRASGRAPVCIAKGVDEIAARIREIAVENAIPIHSDPPTARALHAGVEIGEEIGRDHYAAVAAAIRFAEAMRQKARAR
ncbi:MAG: flagellar biosynthesis protein FlhB [Rhodobacterales bacterium]|nr:flagellar biosynthesis protein FlhB [Rhodobacterales bacterium]NCT13072.1 flagellar biosynthesis protein FlhB [Rhodobacterales bacterium]